MDLFTNLGIGVIKMKKINRILFTIPVIIFLASCSTVDKEMTRLEFVSSKYPSIFAPVRKNLIEGDLKGAITQNNHIGNSKEVKNLNELESGRLQQLNDDFESSINNYNKALKTIPLNQEESLKQAKKILLDKKTYNYYDVKTRYSIPDYAIEFLYTYQALNYLKTNNVSQALKSLDNLDKAKIWAEQQNIIAEGMDHLGKKSLERNDITNDILGLDNFKSLDNMVSFSNRIPNAYGNPMSYYLRAILESAISKSYAKSLTDIQKAQEYTIGNRYLNQTQYEFSSAIKSQTSPFSMGMGRVVVLYEQGLVNTKKAEEFATDLGDIGLRKISYPIYNTSYNFFDPKKVVIADGDKIIVNTYTETLLDTTLFAMKSLMESYSRVITQNVIIESFKSDFEKEFAMGGLLGSRLKFDLSKTDPRQADLRSWLLLPNSVDLFEQQIDSGSYTIQVNNIRQNIEVKQGKTTLLWVVSIGKFNKIYYFIL